MRFLKLSTLCSKFGFQCMYCTSLTLQAHGKAAEYCGKNAYRIFWTASRTSLHGQSVTSSHFRDDVCQAGNTVRKQ